MNEFLSNFIKVENSQLKCLICDEHELITNCNIFETNSKHSNRPLHCFIERFTECNLQLATNQDICVQCLSHVNDYDLAEITCAKIQKGIAESFAKTCKKYEVIATSENVEVVPVVIKEEPYDDKDVPSPTDEAVFDNEGSTSFDDMPLRPRRPVGRPRKVKTGRVMRLKTRVYREKLRERRLMERLTREEKVRLKEEKREMKKNRVYSCDTCTKVFKTKGELTKHSRTHSDYQAFVCEICGKAYRHKAALQVHIGLHSGHSPYQCPICEKLFTQRGSLISHKKMHTGEAAHQCEQCGEQFIHHSSFRMHLLAHDNVRTFTCGTCGLALRSSSHLNRHQRTHTGEKRFPCPVCEKRFAERYNLMSHMRTHSNQPTKKEAVKHECPICSKTFERRWKLKNHLKTNHDSMELAQTEGLEDIKEFKDNIMLTSALNNADEIEIK